MRDRPTRMDADTRVALHTGREMPVLGLGTWLFDSGAEGIVRAVDAGYRMLDTSSDYGTQPDVGEGVRRSDLPRDELYVVTKVEEDDDALPAAKAYVDDMGLDYADLVLIHRPPPHGFGRELWEGLIEARRAGVTRDIGVSNYSVDEIQELIDATGDAPTVNQIEWSPFGHSREMLDFCRDTSIVLQAYSPLTRAERLDDPTLADVAAAYGKSPAQVLIRWNLQLGTVPLPKTRGDHIEENVDVFGFEIDQHDVDRLSGLNEQWSSLGASLLYA